MEEKRNHNEPTCLSEAQRMSKEYGMSLSCALMCLSFEYKFRNHEVQFSLKNPEAELHPYLKGTPENIERGWDILHSLRMRFRESLSFLKDRAFIDFTCAIYHSAPENDKEGILRTLNLFFTTLPEDTVRSLCIFKGKNNRVHVLKCDWERFNKAMKRKKYALEIEDKAQRVFEDWLTEAFEKNKRDKQQYDY